MDKCFHNRKLIAMARVVFPVVILLVWAGVKAQDIGWPREIETAKAKVVIYQPQMETYDGEKMTARAAVSVTQKDKIEPVFGAVWFDCRVITDRDSRIVSIAEVKVPRVKFANATPEQEQKLSRFLEREIPKWDLTISQDRLLTAIESAEKEQATANLAVTPPKIIFAREPTVLVIIDGRPELRPMENSKLMKVVNTPFVIVLDLDTKAYYLYGDSIWYKATDIMGPWRFTANPPATVKAITPKTEASEATEDQGASASAKPRIIVSTEPAELIVSSGEPMYSPLVGNDLLYMSNTESDVLMDFGSRQYYVLLSGRWFKAKSLAGPWTYESSNKLPASFSKIPAESDKGYLRASVAGTEEAQDAVMDNKIPQTTVVKRNEATLHVDYDGSPQFEHIEGTAIDYAVNTNESVLRIGGRYYACHEGIWFVSDSPNGPWIVSDQVPPAMQAIPPNNPMYNTKYVQIYDSTPDVVYTGYTPEYLGSYVSAGTVVWGTGYWYRGWRGRFYYPRPLTWGFGAVYNPWAGRWGYGLPRYAGGFVAAGGAWRNWHGGGWWGPTGYQGWRNASANRVNVGNRNVVLSQNNLYNRRQTAGGAGVGGQSWVSNVPRANIARNVSNNVFTDRDGNVYRRTSEGWQKRDRDTWKKAEPSRFQPQGQRPGVVAARDRTSAYVSQQWMRDGSRVSAGSVDRTRSYTSNVYRGSSSLDRDYVARQRGTVRTNNFQQRQRYYRSSGGGGSRNIQRSTGGGRGGGGRRR